MTAFDKYKKYINETLKNSVAWKELSENEQDRVIKYIFENEEEVADAIDLIIKEKELN